MKTKTIDHKKATLIGVAFTTEECKRLLDSKPVDGIIQLRPQSTWREYRLRCWASTTKIREQGNPVALASSADYSIMLMPRQVQNFAMNSMATNYRLPVNPGAKPTRFLFFCQDKCELDDVLHVQLLALDHPIHLGNSKS